jgi:hypothetical protein
MTVTASPAPRPARSRRNETRDALRAMRPTLLAVGGFLFVALIVFVIGLAVQPSSGPSGDIQASTVEYRIVMPRVLTPGKHTIGLTNDGTLRHELVIFKTDLRASALPRDPGGDVDEESALLENVADSGTPLKPGATESFTTTTLRPGHYVALCNLPEHYQRGMRLDLSVR